MTRKISFPSTSVVVAIEEMETAISLLDRFPYMEPPFWPYNLRSCLGQLLLDAQRWQDAEDVFQTDLSRWPENGWSLKGLELALRGQGRETAADSVKERFEKAWEYADVKLDRACF